MIVDRTQLWEAETMRNGERISSGKQPVTLTEWAESQIRASIMEGELRPSETLVISNLAERMGISATPLREALRKLAAEGLVDLQSHGSARVSEVSLQEANEIYELRLILEPIALERSVTAGDEDYRERVSAAWRMLETEPIAAPHLHTSFHRTLLSNCDSKWLLRLATSLSDRSALIVQVGLPERPTNYRTAEVHHTLMERVIAGDAAGAAEELSLHLRTTLAALHYVLSGSGGAAN